MPDLRAYGEELIQASRKTAILDSNLLVLWISARVGTQTLKQFKRVKPFTEEDIRSLVWLVSQFRDVVTTSYVLAEVSNLANELSGSLRETWFTELAQFATITTEAHPTTNLVGAQSETIRFGITDSALSLLSQTHTLITAEYRLAGYLRENGRSVLNFNDIRNARLLAD